MTARLFRSIYLISSVYLFNNGALHAQTRYNAWFRTTLSYKTTDKLTVDMELHHRRQNGFNDRMMLDHNLMYSVRSWIHYHPSANLRISVSPFAFFRHYPIVNKTGDEIHLPAKETRFSVAALWQKGLSQNFYLIERGAVEYRVLSNQSKNIIRLRNRAGIQYNIKPELSLLLYDEIFINAAGAQPDHFWDHNRMGILLGYKCLPQLKTELGYIYMNRLPLSGTTWLRENNFLLGITYDLPRRPDKK